MEELNVYEEMINRQRERAIQTLQRQYVDNQKKLALSKNQQLFNLKSSLGSELNTQNESLNALERARLANLSNQEVANLQTRNEIKNMTALSGGSVVGAEAIQATQEDMALANIEGSIAQKGVEQYSNIAKLKTGYDTGVLQTNQLFRDQISSLGETFQGKLQQTNYMFSNQLLDYQNLVQVKQREEEKLSFQLERESSNILKKINERNLLEENTYSQYIKNNKNNLKLKMLLGE